MIPYGLPLIYSTVTYDTAPFTAAVPVASLAPAAGSLQRKEAHYDDEDAQQIRPGAVHRQRQLVSPFDQPQCSLHRRREARFRARRTVLASGRNHPQHALPQAISCLAL